MESNLAPSQLYLPLKPFNPSNNGNIASLYDIVPKITPESRDRIQLLMARQTHRLTSSRLTTSANSTSSSPFASSPTSYPCRLLTCTENQIFGGVVLFDWRKPRDRESHEDVSSTPLHTGDCFQYQQYNTLTHKTQPDVIYIHPSHKSVTYRICKLLDKQKKDMLDFPDRNQSERHRPSQCHTKSNPDPLVMKTKIQSSRYAFEHISYTSMDGDDDARKDATLGM